MKSNLKRSREMICPKCGNPIFIYDKETYCYCKKCKKDFRIDKKDDGFSLSPVVVKDKTIRKNFNNFIIILFIFIVGLLFLIYFIHYIDNNTNKNGDVPINYEE